MPRPAKGSALDTSWSPWLVASISFAALRAAGTAMRNTQRKENSSGPHSGPMRRLLSITLLVVAGLALSTAQPSTQARRTADIPQLAFEKVTLPNGLEVILSQ